MYLISRTHHQVWDGRTLTDELTITGLALVVRKGGVALVPFTLKVVA